MYQDLSCHVVCLHVDTKPVKPNSDAESFLLLQNILLLHPLEILYNICEQNHKKSVCRCDMTICHHENKNLSENIFNAFLFIYDISYQ